MKLSPAAVVSSASTAAGHGTEIWAPSAATQGGDRLDNRDGFGTGAQGERRIQFLAGARRALAIGLVDHQHVGNLQDAGLHGLDAVAEPRRRHDHADIGDLGHVDLGLPGADRLDQDDLEPARIQRVDDADRRRRKSPHVTLRGERAHIDAIVVERRRHADAIAENGTPGDRARRVHRDHADADAVRAPGPDQSIHQGRLAGSRRTGDADDVGAAEVRAEGAE